MRTPEYWQAACRELSKRDAVMRRLIKTFPQAELRVRGSAFVTLARAIVGQQISVKAAQSVWNKTEQAVGLVTPQNVCAASAENLRAAGLSRQKVSYLQDLAQHFLDGHIKPRRWQRASDERVLAELTAVKGIGRWTAEMFLIFHLLRPNVFPVDDLGLVRALEKHYYQGKKLDKRRLKRATAKYFALFLPWCTVATWYLWRSLDPIPVTY